VIERGHVRVVTGEAEEISADGPEAELADPAVALEDLEGLETFDDGASESCSSSVLGSS
jgi:hypothetical protein